MAAACFTKRSEGFEYKWQSMVSSHISLSLESSYHSVFRAGVILITISVHLSINLGSKKCQET